MRGLVYEALDWGSSRYERPLWRRLGLEGVWLSSAMSGRTSDRNRSTPVTSPCGRADAALSAGVGVGLFEAEHSPVRLSS